MKEFENQKFTIESDISFESLGESLFEECTFEGLDFSDQSFRSWRFLECEFILCSFNEVSLINTSFRDAVFKDCRLMGAQWSDSKSFMDVKFDGCKLDYSNYSGLDLRRTAFLTCSARDVDFVNANLTEAVFSGTDLQNASFSGADLSRCDLRGAIKYFINPQHTKLKGAKVDLPEAASLLEALGVQVSAS